MRPYIKNAFLILVLCGCAGGAKHADTAANGSRSLLEEKKKVNTDFYFEAFDFKPFHFTKVDGKCRQPSEFKTQEWTKLVANIEHCASQNQWLNVENYALELTKADINSPWGPYYLSLAAEYRKDLPRALWMVDLAIKKASSVIAGFQYQRGRILWQLDQKEAALREMETAAKLDKKIVDAHLVLGEVQFHRLNVKQAIESFQNVLAEDSKNLRALNDISECYVMTGDVQSAARYFSDAVDAHPEVLSTRVRLATVYESGVKDPVLALGAYKSLRDAMAKASVQDRPKIDVNEKIKALEAQVQILQSQSKKPASVTPAPAPAPASAKAPAPKGS